MNYMLSERVILPYRLADTDMVEADRGLLQLRGPGPSDRGETAGRGTHGDLGHIFL